MKKWGGGGEARPTVVVNSFYGSSLSTLMVLPQDTYRYTARAKETVIIIIIIID